MERCSCIRMRHSSNWITVKWIPRVEWEVDLQWPIVIAIYKFCTLNFWADIANENTNCLSCMPFCIHIFDLIFVLYGAELLHTHTHSQALNASWFEKNSYQSVFIMWPNDMNESILQMGNRLFVVTRCRRRRFWYRIAAHNAEAVTHFKPLPVSLKNVSRPIYYLQCNRIRRLMWLVFFF